MPMSKEQYFSQIAGTGVIAVIRAPAKDILIDIAQALIAGGVPGIEVTMSTPNAIAGIEMLAGKFGSQCVVGVGKVLDAPTPRGAITPGGQFVVSPPLDPA